MPDKNNSSNYHAGIRKKKKTKRQASSPLNGNNSGEFSLTNLNSDQRKQRKVQSKQCEHGVSNNPVQSVSGYNFDPNYINFPQNMTFQPQPGAFSMSQPQPSYNIQSPPPPQFGNSTFGYQTAPPPWAAKLLEDMDHIKQKLQSIDKIEKNGQSDQCKSIGLRDSNEKS